MIGGWPLRSAAVEPPEDEAPSDVTAPAATSGAAGDQPPEPDELHVDTPGWTRGDTGDWGVVEVAPLSPPDAADHEPLFEAEPEPKAESADEMPGSLLSRAAAAGTAADMPPVVETPPPTEPPVVDIWADIDESPDTEELPDIEPPPVEPPPAAARADTPAPIHRALTSVVGPSGVDGIPARYKDGREWLEHGIRRHPKGALVALGFAWTGFWLALWGAAIGGVFGILIALGAVSDPAIANNLLGQTVGQAVTPLAVVSGLLLGIVGGFVVVLGWIFVNQPYQWIVGMIAGLILAGFLIVFAAAFERLGLRLRGYRRLSRDEVRRVAPLVREVAEGMNLDGLPRFAMADVVMPNAWTHMRTIVITTGLLQSLDDGELRAVLAHELRHWRSGDSVGLTLVWCCAWPIALTCNIGLAIAGRSNDGTVKTLRIRGGLMSIIGWGIAWPAWVILKLAIVPVMAATSRRYEYEADAAAAQLGYSAQLSSALRKMSAFEGGRTGWERAMAATHPPTELRIEALQAPRPDDAEYQEDELRGPTIIELERFLKPLMRRRTRESQTPAAH